MVTKDIVKPKYIRDTDNVILTDRTKIMNRWREYYGELLNEGYPVTHHTNEHIVEGPISVITETEVRMAMARMANRKATGPDEIRNNKYKKNWATRELLS